MVVITCNLLQVILHKEQPISFTAWHTCIFSLAYKFCNMFVSDIMHQGFGM